MIVSGCALLFQLVLIRMADLVRLSAHHLLRNDLAASVAAALRDSGLPPECLALEPTESVLMHDLEVAIVRLHELKGLGVHLAIDDFGTGYSSLAYLRQLPIDAVKIDKSFVDGVAGTAEESAVARAILALAATLHRDTVAEGVEQPGAGRGPGRVGCHLAQGYHFSRPVPAADTARLTPRRPPPVVGAPVRG